MSAKKNTPQKTNKVVTPAADARTRLRGLYEAAVAAGKEDSAWWAPALKFGWESVHKSDSNGHVTQWAPVIYTDAAGVSAELITRIKGERHCGQIMPLTDAGVAELTARLTASKYKIEKRTKKPTIQIQQFRVPVKTESDGITLLKGPDGKPILPEEDKRSVYYDLAWLINRAFCAETEQRIDRGAAFVAKVAAMKKADKGATAKAILDAFAAEHGAHRAGDMILSADALVKLRTPFPDQDDIKQLTMGAIVAPNIKVAQLVQEHISAQAKANAGKKLSNPMTRVSIDFDQTTGAARALLYDKGKPFLENGLPRYELGKVGGAPVSGENVHEFILSGSTIDGVVVLSGICFSGMGISLPVKGEVLVIDKPEKAQLGLDDLFGDEPIDISAFEAAKPADTPAVASTAASTAASASTSTSTSTSTPTAARQSRQTHRRRTPAMRTCWPTWSASKHTAFALW